MAGESTPRFAIPERPRRRYPRRGGVEYEGETVFVLEPTPDDAGTGGVATVGGVGGGGVTDEGDDEERGVADGDVEGGDDDEQGRDAVLVDLLESVLADPGYRYGDWFDLPMPLYIVHDDVTGDTFRVAVRDGAVEFHVLPATDAPGLRRLFERLRAAVDWGWTVRCRTAGEES